MAVQRETDRNRTRSTSARVGALREFSPAAFSRFTSDINQQFSRLAELLDSLPDFTGFDPTEVVFKRNFEELYNDIVEDDFLSSEGEDVGGSASTRARRNRRTSRQRKQIDEVTSAGLLGAAATAAPPKVTDASALGTTAGIPRFALEDHTHQGVNLDVAQTITALKSFTGGIDGGVAGNNIVVNSNASKNGRMVLGDSTTALERVDVHGVGSTLRIHGTTWTPRVQINEDETVASLSTITSRYHGGTGSLGPYQLFMRGRGTGSSPSAVADDDLLGAIVACGHDGTDYETSAQIRFEIDEGTPSGTAMGGAITLSNTPPGSTTLSERLRISAAGIFTMDTNLVVEPIIQDPGSFGTVAMMQWAQTESFTGALANVYGIRLSPTWNTTNGAPGTFSHFVASGTYTATTGATVSLLFPFLCNLVSRSSTNGATPHPIHLLGDFTLTELTSGTASTPVPSAAVSYNSNPTVAATGNSVSYTWTSNGGVVGLNCAPTFKAEGNSAQLTVSRRGVVIVDPGRSSTGTPAGTITVPENIGLQIDDQAMSALSGAYTVTLAAGIRSAMTQASGKWFIKADGNADSYHRGRLFLGGSTATAASARLHILENTLGNEAARVESVSTNDDPNFIIRQYRTTTTSATVTTLGAITLNASTTTLIEARVVARRTGGTAGTAEDGIAVVVRGAYKMVGGVATALTNGTPATTFESDDQAAMTATLDTSGATVRVRVTGAANNNLTWHATVFIQTLSS